MEKRYRIKKLTLTATSVIIAAAAVYALFTLTGIGWKCPFCLLTGLKCPGCGTTHAITEYLRLNFAAGFRQNMLFPFEALYIVWVVAVTAHSYIKTGSKNYVSPCKALDITVLIIIILWWIVRNIIKI